MHKKYKKIAAVFLSAALLLQGGSGSVGQTTGNGFRVQAQEQSESSENQVQMASETAPELKTAEETQAATEAQTQAATEAQTQAATEAQTQAATEAQTQAATEAQTQTATEAQTQTATEAQTQAATEAQTQAATEAQTQAATEAQTEKQTEEKAEAQTETERSMRKNDGEKMTASKLVDALKKALPFMIAAEKTELPEALAEEMSEEEDVKTDTLVAEGTEGAEIVSGLETFSVKLANGKSSSDVEVINLYADEKGRLDETQLEEKYKDKVIDVTKKYYVINIIAYDADQELDFSGYKMKLSGETVNYEKDTEPGDILYNFAALDGDKLVGYQGELNLKEELQGTFLAPEAEVTVSADLAGAVFADSVTVKDSVKELLHIVFVDGKGAASEETTEQEKSEAENAAQTEDSEETSEITETEISAEATEITETDTSAEATEITEAEISAEVTEITEAEISAEVTEITEAEISAEVTELTEADTSAEVTEASESVEELIEEAEAPALLSEVTEAAEAFSDSSKAAVGLTLHVTDGAGTAIPEAVFVVKNSEGKVLRDGTAGTPLYYLSYTEASNVLGLDGLEPGAYYLSQTRTAEGYWTAKDTAFELKEDQTIEVDGSTVSELAIVNEPIVTENSSTILVSSRSYYNQVLLTAKEAGSVYVALFSDEGLTGRVSDVKKLDYAAGQSQSTQVSFEGLVSAAEDGNAVSYYLAQTDEFGEPMTQLYGSLAYEVKLTDETGVITGPITLQNTGDQSQSGSGDIQLTEEKEVVLNFHYKSGQYPTGTFSYLADVKVTKEVLDQNGAAKNSNETFYLNFYRLAGNGQTLGEKVFTEPVKVEMQGQSSAEVTCQIEMTDVSERFYVREVDASGNVITADTKDYSYAVIYEENGLVEIACASAADEKGSATGVQKTTSVKIQNKVNDSLVKIRVENGSGELLSGASLVIKDAKGKVMAVNGTTLFESKKNEIQWTNILTPGKKYYLSEVKAPSGYTPASDVEFTVAVGAVTEVVMTNTKTVTSEYSLTVSKQVYHGKNAVYAYDTTSGTYAAQGAYTFYAALFSDEARTKKVSDVHTITVSGLGGTTTFKNLEKGKTYYIAETDQYGQVIRSDDSLTVKYARSGKVTMSEKSRTSIIQNSYSSLPKGYRNTGTLTITKKVTNASGEESKVSETFYAGIFRTADYSDTPTIVKLDLSNASSVSVKRRILLSGTKDTVYYMAEVDAQGKRVADSSDFAYTVQVDNPTVTISAGTDAQVTITNKTKATKATLYLTKKVYNGTSLQAVNETFYAGLFKDPEFKNLYTNPIPLSLSGKSEVTLKLTLNLGTASNVKIYVAEVDEDGNVIKDEKSFGYSIKMVNSTAEFTQDRREVQSILLNSVYGTVSNDQWNSILSQSGNSAGSMSGGYWGVSSNGAVSDSEAAQTADNTPILSYAALMGAAWMMLMGLVLRRKRG